MKRSEVSPFVKSKKWLKIFRTRCRTSHAPKAWIQCLYLCARKYIVRAVLCCEVYDHKGEKNDLERRHCSNWLSPLLDRILNFCSIDPPPSPPGLFPLDWWEVETCRRPVGYLDRSVPLTSLDWWEVETCLRLVGYLDRSVPVTSLDWWEVQTCLRPVGYLETGVFLWHLFHG